MISGWVKGLPVAAVLLLTAQAACADGWRIPSPLDLSGSGSFYAEPEFGHQWQNLPSWHTGNLPGTSTPFYASSATADGNQGGASLGYRTPSWLPWGRNQRVEISGNVFDLTDANHQNFSPALPGATPWDTVDGKLSIGTGGVSNADLVTHLYGAEFALRAATDIPVSPALAVTPAVALFGGFAHRANDYRDNQACLGGLAFCFEDTVSERVRTTEIGLDFSAGSRFALSDSWSLLFGAGAAVVHTDADLRASDCFDASPVLGGCQAGTVTNATASHSDFGGRFNGELGLRYRHGIAAIDLLGGARYQTNVPVIINPTGVGPAAHLGSTGESGYTVSLRVSVPLSAP